MMRASLCVCDYGWFQFSFFTCLCLLTCLQWMCCMTRKVSVEDGITVWKKKGILEVPPVWLSLSTVCPAPQVFSAFPQDSAAPGTRLRCAFPPLWERQWQGGCYGDCRGLPPGWAAPTDRGDPGPLQSHQGDAAGGEKEDAGRDGTGAGQADAWQGCGQDVALLCPEHSWWNWWGPELGAHTCLLLLIPAAGAAGRLASPGDTLTLGWVAWFWQELETHSNLSKIFFWCGPFLKSLLNLLQCCFCLCFVFLTMRDVES